MKNICKIIIHFWLAVSLVVSAGEIKTDENIQWMPGAAKISADGTVELPISAWVYEHKQRPGARSALATWMHIDRDKLSADDLARFNQRTDYFRVDSESHKQIAFQIKSSSSLALDKKHLDVDKKYSDVDRKYLMPKTNSYGVATTQVQFKTDSILQQNDLIQLAAVLPPKDERQLTAAAIVFKEEGVSIVSDIDDTIKDSQVLDKQKLLRNTFINPFRSVDGMSQVYQSFAQEPFNVGFHYVSGGPIQLYPMLQDFLKQQNFPQGSVHLRELHLMGELFEKGKGLKTHKLTTIRNLMNEFSKRKFILIGDSGESDPEIYAKIAHEFPQQVQCIYIRNVTQQLSDDARYQKIFSDLTHVKWKIFEQAAEINSIKSCLEFSSTHQAL